MSNAKNTIDYICSLWGGNSLNIPQKLEWVENDSFSTREGLEKQAKYLKPGGYLFAYVWDERENQESTKIVDSGKKSQNLMLKSFIVE